LNARHLAEVAVAEELKYFKHLLSQRVVERYQWIDSISTNEPPRFWDVWYPGRVLVTSTKGPGLTNVSVFQLPFRAQLLWLRFLWKHPRLELSIARASWANMFTCLGIAPSKSLVIRRQRADVIPSAMDAPLQNTDLSTVLQWCYLLGLKNIQLDLTEATISARNIYASITTTNLNVPGLAKVISLDGDLDSLRRRVSWATSGELRTVIEMANGRLFYVALQVDCRNHNPFHILYALQNGWTVQKQLKEPRGPGNLYWETENYSEKYREIHGTIDLIDTWPRLPRKFGDKILVPSISPEGFSRLSVAVWSRSLGEAGIGRCPSLLQTLAFLPYHNIYSAFPIRHILSLHYDLENKITAWWAAKGTDLCSILPLQSGLFPIRGYYLFSPASQFLLSESRDVSGCFGSRSWIFFSSHNGLKAWNPDCFKQMTDLDQCSDFDSPFPLLNDVGRLLQGTTVARVRDEYVSVLLHVSDGFSVRIEPALWFSLFSVEGRIEALWDEILKVGSDTPKPKISSYKNHVSSLTELNWGKMPAEHKPLEPSLAGFLALWLDVCGRDDPFDKDFDKLLEEVLQSWREDEELCIPKPVPDHFVDTLPPDNPVAPPWKKGEFYRWADQGKRMKLLPKMVPWLQLRSALMYHFLLCNEDSSDLRAAQAAQIQVRVA
jgi:hypothetical protein